MNEFETIATYFRPLTCGHDDLLDDAAVLDIPKGHELVVTSDTLNEGIHFLEGERAAHIARKSLRVNISDLAAMGAKPLCYQLNLAFPQKPSKEWLTEFSQTLQAENEYFDIFCSGGDTTSLKGDHLSISITAMGMVPKGKAIRRSGAKQGDAILVTGDIGGAVLGLKILQEQGDQAKYAPSIERYRMPQPCTDIRAEMQRYAHAAVDISDGLLADCAHIARASNLMAEISLDQIPLSDEVRGAVDAGIITMEQAIKGGDDYELILVVPHQSIGAFENATPIGRFIEGTEVLNIIPSADFDCDVKNLGWMHF